MSKHQLKENDAVQCTREQAAEILNICFMNKIDNDIGDSYCDNDLIVCNERGAICAEWPDKYNAYNMIPFEEFIKKLKPKPEIYISFQNNISEYLSYCGDDLERICGHIKSISNINEIKPNIKYQLIEVSEE